MELPALVKTHHGLCYPAHIDREANGLFGVLGGWPPELEMNAAEIKDHLPAGLDEGLKIIRSSDAHTLLSLPTEGCLLPLREASFNGLLEWIKK